MFSRSCRHFVGGVIPARARAIRPRRWALSTIREYAPATRHVGFRGAWIEGEGCVSIWTRTTGSLIGKHYTKFFHDASELFGIDILGTVQASMVYDTPEFEHASRMLDAGAVEPRAMITGIVAMQDLPAQFEALRGTHALLQGHDRSLAPTPDDAHTLEIGNTKRSEAKSVAIFQHRRTQEYVALGGCMLIAAVENAVFVACFPLWVVPWVNDFHIPRAAAMSAFGIGNAVVGLVSPLVGRSLERFPARNNISCGGLMLALGFLLASFATTFWQITAIYSVVLASGAAFTGTLPAQTVAIRVMPQKAGTVGGLINLGISVGGVAVPVLLTFTLASLGWRKTFLVASALILVTIVPAVWILLQGYGGRGAAGRDPSGAEAQAALSLRALLASGAFWMPLVLIVPILFVVGTVLPNAVSIAADGGIDIHMAGYLVAAISAGGASGSIVLGWLADRFDYRMLFTAIAIAVFVTLLMLLRHLAPLPMAEAFFVVGFAAGGVFPLLGS